MSEYLDNYHELAKILIRCNRDILLKKIAKYKLYVPMNYDNLFWLVMFLEAPKDHEIYSKIPNRLLSDWNMRVK